MTDLLKMKKKKGGQFMGNKDFSYAVCFYSIVLIALIVMILKLTSCAGGINPNHYNNKRSIEKSYWRLCKEEEVHNKKPWEKAMLCKSTCLKWKYRNNADGVITKLECKKENILLEVMSLNDKDTFEMLRSMGMRLKK